MNASLDYVDEVEYETDKVMMKHKSKKIKVPRFGFAARPDQLSLSKILDEVRKSL